MKEDRIWTVAIAALFLLAVAAFFLAATLALAFLKYLLS